MLQQTITYLLGQSVALVPVSHLDSDLACAHDDVGVPGSRVYAAVGTLQTTVALLHVAPELPVINAACGVHMHVRISLNTYITGGIVPAVLVEGSAHSLAHIGPPLSVVLTVVAAYVHKMQMCRNNMRLICVYQLCTC